MKTTPVLALGILALLSTALFAVEREWTDLTGTKITAELAAVEGGQAVLLMKGKEYRVLLETLSDADREFVREWQGAREKTAASAETGEVAAPPQSELLAAMQGALVRLEGRQLVPHEIPNPEKIKVVAFYSSASWCGPCQAFSPKLAKEYKSLKRKHENFEVVLLTSDREREAWEEYIREHKMPFPSVDFEKASIKDKLASGKNYGYIPSLLIKTVEGKVLDDASNGAEASLEHLEDILREYAKE